MDGVGISAKQRESLLTVAKSASKALPEVARIFGFRYLLSTRTINLSQSKISNQKSKMV